MTFQRFAVLCLTALLALVSVAVAGLPTAPDRRGDYSFYFSNPRYIDGADSTLRATRARLQTLLGHDLAFAADVYMVESEAVFDSLIGGIFPDWGAAAAVPIWKRIVIKSPDSFQINRSLAELLSHEYAHLALAHRTGLHSAPRWFEEGFAMVASMEWSWSHNLTLNLASITNDFVPLREIERVNRFGQARARLAYAQSYLTVNYLFDTYGIEGVNIFLDAIARGSSLDNALMAATGSDYDDFQGEIDVYLHGRFNLLGLMADTMFFWLALAVVVIIGFVLTMRRRQQYYRKWDEEEQLASTDFDYGDTDQPEEIDDDEPWRQ